MGLVKRKNDRNSFVGHMGLLGTNAVWIELTVMTVILKLRGIYIEALNKSKK